MPRYTHRHARAWRSCLALAALAPIAAAQSCIPLSGSTTCPAFKDASISTDQSLQGIYPWLANVTSTSDFDQALNNYVNNGYVQLKYQTLLGCSNVNLSNTTGYYARYTLSMICNVVVQNSIQPCSLSAAQAPPLCADACAQQATSEEQITASQQLCGTPGSNYMSQIRADFTNCALPADSLSGKCITGEENEPDECGFSSNLGGLCSYCAASSPNATDSCCVASNVTHRCQGVTLPTVSSLLPLITSSTATKSPTASSTSSNTAAAAAASTNHGLTGGAIAGIVIGALIGAALLLGLLILCCVALRRRRRNKFSSPKKTSPVQTASSEKNHVVQPPPGGRIARMTALEGSESSGRNGMDPMLAAEKRRYEQSDSDPYNDSTPSRGAVHPSRRQGSLSSNSALGALGGATTGEETTSLSGAGGQYSSPGDVHSGQSEQLPFFRDYYSNNDIHPHERVAVLWGYSPRAQDEFELARGDMIRVVGIWDDGWATGVRLPERADDWEGEHTHHPQRDSGISQGDTSGDDGRKSPLESGEVRAFPLVCVCAPSHWRKAVEADASTDSTSPPPGQPQLPDRPPSGPEGGQTFRHF